ncbi:uncharacterized [Tachysurus ichikawai]
MELVSCLAAHLFLFCFKAALPQHCGSFHLITRCCQLSHTLHQPKPEQKEEVIVINIAKERSIYSQKGVSSVRKESRKESPDLEKSIQSQKGVSSVIKESGKKSVELELSLQC